MSDGSLNNRHEPQSRENSLYIAPTPPPHVFHTHQHQTSLKIRPRGSPSRYSRGYKQTETSETLDARSRLLLGLLLDLFLILILRTVGLGAAIGRTGTVGFPPFGEDAHRLVNLLLKGWRGFDEVKKLPVVHLEEHTSDLAREIGMGPAVMISGYSDRETLPQWTISTYSWISG